MARVFRALFGLCKLEDCLMMCYSRVLPKLGATCKRILPQRFNSCLSRVDPLLAGPIFFVVAPLLMVHGAVASKYVLIDPMCGESFVCSGLFHVLGIYLLILCLWTYYRASLTDPGRVPASWQKWDGQLATRPPIPNHAQISPEWLDQQAKELMENPDLELKPKEAPAPKEADPSEVPLDPVRAAAAAFLTAPPPSLSGPPGSVSISIDSAAPALQRPSKFEAESVVPGYEMVVTPEMMDPHPTRYCEKCKQYKPPRTHHCSKCKRCVLRLDHHCVWLNTCVGRWNHKYFFQATVVMRQATQLYMFAYIWGVLTFLYTLVTGGPIEYVTEHLAEAGYATFLVLFAYAVYKWMDHLVEHQKLSMHLGVTRFEEIFDPPHQKGRYHMASPWIDYTFLMGNHWTHWIFPIDPYTADQKARELEGTKPTPYKMPNGGTLLFNHTPAERHSESLASGAADQLDDLFSIGHGHSHGAGGQCGGHGGGH